MLLVQELKTIFLACYVACQVGEHVQINTPLEYRFKKNLLTFNQIMF